MGWAFCGGLWERRNLFCPRRGTFPAQEKYPKARQNQGFGILSGRQEGAVGRSLNFESSAVLRRCR